MKTIALIALPIALLTGCNDQTETASSNASVAAAPVTAPGGSNWAETISATPEGFVMGNPDAPIKLVEYGSFTCSHCGDFVKEAMEPLRTKYIASGKVSFELRNYVRDPIDVTATLLARCGGTAPYFPLAEAMFVDQTAWLSKIQTLGQAEYERIGTLAPAQQFAAFAKATGLDEFARQRGISAARANACLADEGALNTLVATRDRANKDYNMTGTPTFLINGQVVPETANWTALEPKLRAAGA